MERKYIAIDLVITLKCNGHCKCCSNLCDINMPDSSTMTVEDVECIMEEIDRFNQINDEFCVNEIRVLGGEPTMHPDLIKIIECIQKHKHVIRVMSNKSADDETYKVLEKMGVCLWFTGSIGEKHNNHFMFPAELEKLGYVLNVKDVDKMPCCYAFSIRKVEGNIKYFFCPGDSTLAIVFGIVDQAGADNLIDAISQEKRQLMIEKFCPLCWHGFNGQQLPLAKNYDMNIHCPSIVPGIEKYKQVK